MHTESGKEYRGAALIGADGLWSTIRQIVVGDGKPNVAGHITYRAVLPTSEMPEKWRWRDMVLWAGEKVHLVHYPLRTGELFNLVAVFHSDRYEEGWDSYGDPAELHERFAKTCEPVRTLLNKIESWRMWVLCDRPPIKDWSRGRITLLGDAAHPMLQYLAQGAGMSIEDAVCLADRVAASKGDYRGGIPRLSAGALSAHRPRADHGAGLWRVLSRRRRGEGAAQHDARLALGGRRHGGHGVALRRAERADARRGDGGLGGDGVSMRRYFLLRSCRSGMLAAGPAAAEDNFYAGKTIDMLIGFSAGGGYDIYARTVARYLGRHIPGNPQIVPQNMPGAGSLKLVELSLQRRAEGRHRASAISRRAFWPSRCSATAKACSSTPPNSAGSAACRRRSASARSRPQAGIATVADMKTKPKVIGASGGGAESDVFATVLAQHVPHADPPRHRLSGRHRDHARHGSATKSTAAAAGRGPASSAATRRC